MAEVEVSRDGAVQTITLNRPDKLNAFTRALHGELQAALEEARDPDGTRRRDHRSRAAASPRART